MRHHSVSRSRAISAPLHTDDAIFVERVNQRVLSDSLAWQKQKSVHRAQATDQLRQQRVREFLKNLRESADIVGRRKQVESPNRAVAQ